MPWIFRYFWFVAAAFMAVNLVFVRRRLAPLVDRGAVTRGEVDRFVYWLGAWFVIGPLVFGAIGLAAGWPSPFCGGVMEFGSRDKMLLSIANLAIWVSVLWWIWRGGGAEFLSRAGPALGRQPSYDKRYSPRMVRVVGTAIILFSSIGAAVSWRTMPPSPEMSCSAASSLGHAVMAPRTASAVSDRAMQPSASVGAPALAKKSWS